MWSLFKDKNEINEKNVVGFASFVVMVLFAIADLTTSFIFVGEESKLIINEVIYNSFVWVVLGSFGISEIGKTFGGKKESTPPPPSTKDNVNVKGFMLQPVGPEALGWFSEPIASMDDFRKYRFRAPPGMVGQAYKDIGVASVAMGGGDILPALEKGTIDAAEWCCPVADQAFGFQKVLKHYYLQGLHQVVVNADMYVNGDFYDSLTDTEKKALEVAANASLSKSMSYRILANGRALKDLTENHGVILHDTPADYFPAYMDAAKALLEKGAAENEFFAEVWQSQKDFADIAIPFWAGAQASNAALGKAHADTLK